jgi:hypothetical protein
LCLTYFSKPNFNINTCQYCLLFLSYIRFHCMYIPHLFYLLSFGEHFSCFHFLVLVNDATMNESVQIFPKDPVFNFFEYTSMSLLGHVVVQFLILWDPSILFAIISESISDSYYKYSRAPVSPHPCQHLVLFIFVSVAILRNMKWHLIVTVSFLSLVITDVAQLLVNICVLFFFEERTIQVLC